MSELTIEQLEQDIRVFEEYVGQAIVDFTRKTNKPIIDVKLFHNQNGLSVMALVGAANIGSQIIRPN